MAQMNHHHKTEDFCPCPVHQNEWLDW